MALIAYRSPVPEIGWRSGTKTGEWRCVLKEGNLLAGDGIKVNILVMDDEESIRFSFSRILTGKGHNVITAGGYKEALARMSESVFELILADIVLGDGWGMDILGEVMKRKLKTKVIIMTAYPTTATAQESYRMHAVDYLVKPFKQAELINSINKALEN